MAFVPSLLNSAINSATSATVTSGTIAPSANALLVVTVVGLRPTGGAILEPTCADTLSGGSLTWTRRVSIEGTAAGTQAAAIFTALAGATPGTGTVTVTWAATCGRQGIDVLQIPDGYHATTPFPQVASNTGTGDTLTVTFAGTPTASSMVIGTIGARAADGDIAPGATFTQLDEETIGVLGSNSINHQTQYDITSAPVGCDWSGIGTGSNVAAVAIEIAAAAGGPDYTLTGDAGSYTLSGQAATLAAARRLVGDVGSYGLTGIAASLLASRKLTADAGSYALTGQAASLLVSRLLAAGAGAYTLTGQDATLVYTPLSGPDYTLVADAGSYALTGQTVSLLVNRLLAADSGAYVLSGQDASFLLSRLLTADAGAYTVSGQAASLAMSRLLAAATGSYSLNGQSVTFVYSGEEVPVTPDTRVYIVPVEDRVFVIVAEERIFVIVEEERVYAIT